MNFCLYFPHLLSGLGEVQCETSAHNSVEHLCPENCWQGCTLLVGINEIILTRVSQSGVIFRN